MRHTGEQAVAEKQYFRMEMKESSSIEEHIMKMKELTDKFAALKAPISGEEQVVTLLGSLPPRYSTWVTALEARDALSLSYVQQSLINEEQKSKGSCDVASGGTGRVLSGREKRAINRGSVSNVVRLDIFIETVPRAITI